MEDAVAHPLAATRWHARPRLAIAIRVVAALLPFVGSVLVTRAVQRRLPPPDGLLALVATWVLLAVIGTVVLWGVERVSRRLLPLAALLKMSLVFPDAAPSRFRSAIRTGTVAQLERRIEDVQEQGIGNTPAEAARTLIDLLAALNRHDRLTRGHAERVRAYSRLIGEEMGFDEEKLELLHWAALVHDIGKLVVPSEILTKPGSLTDEEFDIVRGHPAAGAAMVEPLADWLGEWRLAVLEHHEKWDGTGYPQGLAGDEISLAGRIVAVADVFDVITSPRSYKPAISADDARKEIARCSGTHFDPTVVRAFLNIGISRLRLLLGPLAWLSQIRFIGDLPLAPIGALATGTAASVAAVVGGVVGATGPDASVAAAAAGPPATTEVAWGATPTTLPTTTTAYVAPSTTTTSSTTTTVPVVVEVPPEQQVVDVVVSDAPKEMEPPAPAPPAPPTPPTPPATVPPTTVPPTTTTQPPTTTTQPPTTTTAPPTTTTTPPPPPPVNTVPVTVADALSVAAGATATVDVLANDTDGDGNGLVLMSVDTTGVDGGTVTFDPGGVVTYVALAGASGSDTIVYTVGDGAGGVTQGSLTVTIGGLTAVKDVADAVGGTVASAAPGVLGNDIDPEGDPLTVTAFVPQNAADVAAGALTWAADGSYAFTAVPGFEGVTKWTYTVSDGNGGTDTEKLEITVTENAFTGSLFLDNDDKSLSAAVPPVVNPEPDSPGGDSLPGLTIETGGADEDTDDGELEEEIVDKPEEFGVWTGEPSATAVVFDGDAELRLFTKLNGLALLGANVEYFVWVQECNPATNQCETIAFADETVPFGLNLLGGWDAVTIPLGSIDHEMLAGWHFRLVVAVDGEDISVAATGDRPSQLVFTG